MSPSPHPLSAHPVLILAGGTGGHIFPGIAVARALRAQGVPVLWLGAEGGMETRLVPAADLELVTIRVRSLRGKGFRRWLMAPVDLTRALLQAARVLAREQPRAVVSFGGYVAGPAALVAWLRRLPVLLHEQNSVPGLTNRILARLARRRLCGFPQAFAGRACDWVGNPVRADIAQLPTPEARALGQRGPLRILVLGGSQGALALNNAVPAALARLRAGIHYEVWHQCGQEREAATRARYAEFGVAAVQVRAFIEDMAQAWAWADLVICRAGALTLAEVCAAGVAAILVPFPAAVDDHQTRNAHLLSARGAALLLAESVDLPERLSAQIERLACNRGELLHMAKAARVLARPDAAQAVAAAIIAECAA